VLVALAQAGGDPAVLAQPGVQLGIPAAVLAVRGDPRLLVTRVIGDARVDPGLFALGTHRHELPTRLPGPAVAVAALEVGVGRDVLGHQGRRDGHALGGDVQQRLLALPLDPREVERLAGVAAHRARHVLRVGGRLPAAVPLHVTPDEVADGRGVVGEGGTLPGRRVGLAALHALLEVAVVRAGRRGGRAVGHRGLAARHRLGHVTAAPSVGLAAHRLARGARQRRGQRDGGLGVVRGGPPEDLTAALGLAALAAAAVVGLLLVPRLHDREHGAQRQGRRPGGDAVGCGGLLDLVQPGGGLLAPGVLGGVLVLAAVAVVAAVVGQVQVAAGHRAVVVTAGPLGLAGERGTTGPGALGPAAGLGGGLGAQEVVHVHLVADGHR